MRSLIFLFILCFIKPCNAQHFFEGYIDNERWQNDVYLSVIEDYRTLNGIHNEQIITKTEADSLGYFKFEGDQLEPELRIYKLHVDNCETFGQRNHFNGQCPDSHGILFLARGSDSISFPLSFEAQMFCDIQSSNPRTAALVQVDSLKEEMRFAYAEFPSEANKNLNNKKWFKRLQEFGENLNEPLAELYIYAFLSDRGNPFHDHYLEDLQSNVYYDELLNRLTEQYPNSNYLKQYRAELRSDRSYALESDSESTKIPWIYILSGLLVLSLAFNFWFMKRTKTHKEASISDMTQKLTNQEQNILELLLQNNSNKDIADSLFVSVSTVKTHVNNVFRKFNVSSRDELKSLFKK